MSIVTPAIKQEPAQSPSLVRPHFLFLDGLRALAACYVMLVHVWAIFGLTLHSGWVGHVERALRYGHLAVDVFIVLSGYCLVLPVAQAGFLKGGVKHFFWKRAHRILPPFYACMAVCLLLNIIVQKVGHTHGAFTAIGLAMHLGLIQDMFPRYSGEFNGPLWSVALEWKIYFLFPLVALLLRRYGIAATLVATALIGYSIALPFYIIYPHLLLHPAAPWYVFLFGLGASAGWACYRSVKLSQFKLVRYMLLAPLITFAVVMYFHSPDARVDNGFYGTLFPVIDPLVGLLTAGALLLLHPHPFLQKPPFATRILSWKPLVFVGSFSYSLYLMHVPFASIWRLFMLHSPCAHLSVDGRAILNIFVGIPFILLSSYIFYLLIERPFLNRKRQLTMS